MNHNKKTTIMLAISMVVPLLLITIGLSFAYFTANITNTEESTTINVTGGVMTIHYDSEGQEINAPNIEPSDNPFGTKTFTLTGNNTTNEDMLYHIILIVEENTFTENALKYKLTSTNTDNNGQVAPSIEELTGIPSGENQEVFLGNANFTSPTEGNKVHTYNLELYFPETGEIQNHDMDKTFKAHIEIREGHKAPLLVDEILAQYGGADNIQEAPIGTFDSMNGETDSIMYKMEDDYGWSYYYRGAKEYLNNNLIFAEHQWKIVRINGDGSIRIIYNGECPGNVCSINSTGTRTRIADTAFNSSANDNKYVGYMYGTYSTNYETAHKNQEDSTIKTELDTWYENNIKGTRYEGYLSDTIFCADRTIQSGDGFGGGETSYGPYNRLHTNKTPSLKCSRKEDRITVIETEKGNGALTHPIALLTADEASLAGLLQGTGNSTNYLYTNEDYWLLSPARFSGSASPWRVYFLGDLLYGIYATNTLGARGVLNLNSNTEIIGTGTSSDPYKVI